jgi:hypothetical protein
MTEVFLALRRMPVLFQLSFVSTSDKDPMPKEEHFARLYLKSMSVLKGQIPFGF